MVVGWRSESSHSYIYPIVSSRFWIGQIWTSSPNRKRRAIRRWCKGGNRIEDGPRGEVFGGGRVEENDVALLIAYAEGSAFMSSLSSASSSPNAMVPSRRKLATSIRS